MTTRYASTSQIQRLMIGHQRIFYLLLLPKSPIQVQVHLRVLYRSARRVTPLPSGPFLSAPTECIWHHAQKTRLSGYGDALFWSKANFQTSTKSFVLVHQRRSDGTALHCYKAILNELCIPSTGQRLLKKAAWAIWLQLAVKASWSFLTSR